MSYLLQNKYSIAVIWLIFIFLVMVRLQYLHWETNTVSGTLTWDAFGYYLYLPGEFIYHDIGELKWLKGILDTYNPTGELYQVCALPNGHFAMKYLMGLSILYSPFFFLGHLAAGWLGYPQDGFSAPYQLAICLGALVYSLMGLEVLRRVLRHFFSDVVTASTLLLLVLASNYPQYVAIDSGQTHGFLFSMYALVLWNMLKWCERPTIVRAFLLGLLIGLSCIVRPTEGVMLFLVLLWRVPKDGKEWSVARLLWRTYPPQLWAALTGGFLGILPQLIYWKRVTDHWIFDVGSSWRFLTPHWRVLIGGEKGWFIYTPVTILFVAGLFFMKDQPYRKAVRTFFILNTWIIIAWADWRYGATYSSRAMLQGCAVLALPFGLLVERCFQNRYRYLFAMGGVFLIYLNLFQLWQYNRTIIHYDDNNFAYYGAVFLDSDPTALDMSLLDTQEMLRDTSGWAPVNTVLFDTTYTGNTPVSLWSKPWHEWVKEQPEKDGWLLITAQVRFPMAQGRAHLTTRLQQPGVAKQTAVRLESGISKTNEWNPIGYWFYVPAGNGESVLSVMLDATGRNDLEMKDVSVRVYRRL